MRTPPLLFVLAALTAAACYDPSYQSPRCGPDGDCPPGLVCSNGENSECRAPAEQCLGRRDAAYAACLADAGVDDDDATPAAKAIQRRCDAEANLGFSACCEDAPDATCAPLPEPPCAAEVPVVDSVAPLARLNDLFTAYGNQGTGWTGGDGVTSLRLPDGRELWTFSDTFLGEVGAGGSRPASAPLVNSSFVVQDGDQLATVDRLPLVGPPDARHFYWAGAGTVEIGDVQVIFQRFTRTGDGMWNFRFDGNVLARWSPDALDQRPVVTPLPSEHGVSWGAAILPAAASGDGYNYIYGVEDVPGGKKYLHVARVEGSLAGPWEYWTDRHSWSRSEAASARRLTDVSNGLGVVRVRGQFLLVTQDSSEAFSNKVVAYAACAPAGPFAGAVTLYRTPESGPFGSYRNGNVYTYNARAHGELSNDDAVVVSYSVNSLVADDVYRDVTIYRPRFLELRLR